MPGEGRVQFLKVNKWLILRDLQTCALMVPLCMLPDPLYFKLWIYIVSRETDSLIFGGIAEIFCTYFHKRIVTNSCLDSRETNQDHPLIIVMWSFIFSLHILIKLPSNRHQYFQRSIWYFSYLCSCRKDQKISYRFPSMRTCKWQWFTWNIDFVLCI